MTYQETMGWLALIIGFTSYLPYFYSIYKGTARPHAFSWFVWGLLCTIAFIAQTLAGAGAGAWATGLTGFMCVLIFITALFRGEKNITRSDCISFGGAIITLCVWFLTKDPFWAIILISLTDALGYFPTYRKSWHKPYEEVTITYGMNSLKFLISLFALEQVTFTTALYPASLVFTNGLFAAMILWRRKMVRTHG